MFVLELDTNLNCSSDAAWQVLADFGNFLPWATGGAGTVSLEGEGLGMIRHLDIPGLGQVSEQLDLLDDVDRILGYAMVSEAMAGMANYSASVQVFSVGEQHCRLQWRGRFKPLPDLDSDEVKNSLATSYKTMAQGLEAFVNARSS